MVTDSSAPLPDIPEQPAPVAPEVLIEEANPPNLSLSLDDLKVTEKINELAAQQDNLTAERAMLWQRKVYAFLLFTQSTGWLVFIGVFLWHAGIKHLAVADSVLIALITTTTLNVLGLFYIVARWLFPHTQPEKNPRT